MFQVELTATQKKLRQMEERHGAVLTTSPSGPHDTPGRASVSAGSAQRPKLPPPPFATPTDRPRTAPSELSQMEISQNWMGEQLQNHAVENLRLREQLLFFTSKSAANLGSRGKGHASSTMPLPPV